MAAGKFNMQANDGAIVGLVVPDGLGSGERQIALGVNLSGITAYHLLSGNLSATVNANYVEVSATTTRNYTTSDYIFDSLNNKLYDCILASTAGALLTNTTYFTLITAGTLQLNTALIPFANGIDSNGAKNTIVYKNETITGLTYTAGKNYVYAKNDGTYGVKPYRPRYLRSDLVAEKVGDNPDYFDVLSNTWYSTVTNPELVTNGTFTDGTTGWINGAGIATIVNGTLQINGYTYWSYQDITTEIGKKYKFKCSYMNGGSSSSSISVGTVAELTTYPYAKGSYVNKVISPSVSESFTMEFVAQEVTTRIAFACSSSGAQFLNVDNISVYATDLELNAPITARNYLDTIAYADASGQLTYVEELPKTQYFDRIETGSNRKVMYLADYGIAQIQNNKRYVLDNPFGNDRFMDCDTKLEIYDAVIGKWIEVGHSIPGAGSATFYGGAKSFSTIDGIVIATAFDYLLMSTNTNTIVIPYSPSGALTSAPARVIIQFNGKTGRTR